MIFNKNEAAFWWMSQFNDAYEIVGTSSQFQSRSSNLSSSSCRSHSTKIKFQVYELIIFLFQPFKFVNWEVVSNFITKNFYYFTTRFMGFFDTQRKYKILLLKTILLYLHLSQCEANMPFLVKPTPDYCTRMASGRRFQLRCRRKLGFSRLDIKPIC